jgi:hypothetical protein
LGRAIAALAYGKYDASLKTDLGKGHENEPALTAKVARMKDNMLVFDEAPKDVKIVDEKGKPLLASDTDRRFSKVPGCTGLATNTISPTRPATRICLLMQSAALRMGLLLTKA